jgi:hypothetical protein
VNAAGKRGAEVKDGDRLTLVTSDFVALGGDHADIPKDRAKLEDELVRDALEKGLMGKGELHEKEVLDLGHPRWKLPSERPVRCAP